MRLHQALGQQTIFESIGGTDPYFKTWQRDIHPVLCEVALNPDQINQLFKSIEKGGGRSLLGKAKDAISGATNKISDVWFNKFGGMLQSSGPVQAFDQKFEEIKSSIAAKNPKLAAKLAKYGEFAKNNPKLHKFLLAIGGSVAAAVGVTVAGGVGAGALAVGTGAGVATGIINIADRLLQGQKASTAIGRGATTGLVTGITAAAATKILSGVANSFKAEYVNTVRGERLMNGTFDINGQWTFVTGRPEDVRALGQAMDAENYQLFYSLVEKMRSPEYVKGLEASQEIIKQATQNYQSTAGVIKTLAQAATAAAGGAASAATNQQPKESLSENKIYELFGITGNKIDASKLEKAWKKAGSPTDSDEIAKILQGAGVDPTIISQAFKEIGAPTPQGRVEPTLGTDTNTTAQPINTKDIVARIKKLPPDQQKILIQLLKA
ncbi:MAG: hypothetical protein EBU90_04530 [Proteobacteria bacterium]|nr:hypothetical protein [Pseudomonadota bacterium]NBP13708.1 hypothetical protein [bacterium]